MEVLERKILTCNPIELVEEIRTEQKAILQNIHKEGQYQDELIQQSEISLRDAHESFESATSLLHELSTDLVDCVHMIKKLRGYLVRHHQKYMPDFTDTIIEDTDISVTDPQ